MQQSLPTNCPDYSNELRDFECVNVGVKLAVASGLISLPWSKTSINGALGHAQDVEWSSYFSRLKVLETDGFAKLI